MAKQKTAEEGRLMTMLDEMRECPDCDLLGGDPCAKHRNAYCEECGGSGEHPGADTAGYPPCETCGGTGRRSDANATKGRP